MRCSGALSRFTRGCQPGLVLRRPGWQLLLASVGRLWNTFFVAVLYVAALPAFIAAVLAVALLSAVAAAAVPLRIVT